MKLFKKNIFIVFLIIIFSLILSTILPREVSQRYFYKALWFKSPWFILSIGILISIVNYYRRKENKVILVYLGFLLILLGGLMTSLWEKEGFIEIKKHGSVDGYWREDGVFELLDFSLSLQDFSVEFYPEIKGKPRFVKSYKSLVAVKRAGNILKEGVIKVNKPLSFGGFNFYQYGYDVDLPEQTVLQVVRDPGLPWVYSGYFVLLAGMLISFKRIWKTSL